jgi:Lar family restriction alleviation protein
MSDNKELLPCPFCGSDDLHSTGNGVYSSYIECNGCGASGPAADHADNEQALWNRRAAQPVVLSDEQISDLKNAISETEYKYFGCYEFTEKQHTAVDVLIEVARMVIAAKEQA